MNKWEIESKITSDFSGMLTQGQQEVLDYIERLQQKLNRLEKKNKALLKQKNEAINYIKNSKKLGLRYHSEETLFKMQTIYRMLVGREEGGSNE